MAAAVDVLFVLVPPGFEYLGLPGSPLTTWLHDHSLYDDNILSRIARVPYDRGGQVRPDLGAPKLHRLYALGHDFPFGLIVGVFDVMRGGLTAIDEDGCVIFADGLRGPVHNPFVALAEVVLHWLSDGFTKVGLPPPGWAATQLLQFGSVTVRGEERNLASVARWMYVNGYDARHCLTASTSVAAAAVTLRGYYHLRRLLDEAYELETDHEARASGAAETAEHPRYVAMSLIANTLAVAANAGRIALFAPSGLINPAAFNYPQWRAWGRAILEHAGRSRIPLSERLIGRSHTNLVCLEEAWVSDPFDEGLELEGLHPAGQHW